MPDQWQTAYEKVLLALVIWREARSEPAASKYAVAWTVRNRVESPRWWGNGWIGVITKFAQFSSMTIKGDPNTVRWPKPGDQTWLDCQTVAQEVYEGSHPDPIEGGTYYFDKTLDHDPPAWAADMKHVADIGAFHFYKEA